MLIITSCTGASCTGASCTVVLTGPHEHYQYRSLLRGAWLATTFPATAVAGSLDMRGWVSDPTLGDLARIVAPNESNSALGMHHDHICRELADDAVFRAPLPCGPCGQIRTQS